MTCSSCDLRSVVLVVLDSPRGEYALCVRCLGRDLEPRVAPTLLARGDARRRSA